MAAYGPFWQRDRPQKQPQALQIAPEEQQARQRLVPPPDDDWAARASSQQQQGGNRVAQERPLLALRRAPRRGAAQNRWYEHTGGWLVLSAHWSSSGHKGCVHV